MSDATKAVFLSYASQDAEAARRIADALRAAGVEVWFDQNELVGGDAWDAKIRGQIAECALFVPLISAATQARREGYFRLEWRIAAQRTHMMSEQVAFLLPVVIDATRDAEADVPGEFKTVQWTKLPGGETPEKFCARVQTLLGGEVAPASSRPLPQDAGRMPALRQKRSTRSWPQLTLGTLAILVIGIVLFFALRPHRGPEKIAKLAASDQTVAASATAKSTPGTAPVSEARQLVLKARKLFEAPEVTNRENILLAERLCTKAVELDPADAEVWAARAQLSYLMEIYGHDRTPARLQAMASDAQRAVTLASGSYEARLAEAYALARQPARRSEAEPIYRALLKEKPGDSRITRNLGHLLRWQGKVDEGLALLEQAAALPGGDPIALADRATALVFLARLPEAEQAAEQSLAQAPTGRAYLIHTLLQLILRGDTDRARQSLEHVPAAVLRENRGVNIATWVWLWRREPDRCLDFLRSVPQDYVDDIYFTGPKSVLTGLAHQLAGRAAAARADWEAALAMLDARAEAQTGGLKMLRCELLARLGRQGEAGRLYAEIEQAGGPGWRGNGTGAMKLLVLLGRTDEALTLLPDLIDRPADPCVLTRAELRLNPFYDPLRGDPRFQRLLTAPVARPAASAVMVAPDSKSVAVLAFANLSDDKGNEYFSDGISEELLNVLAKIPDLKVAARTSSFYFKGKQVPMAEIAQQLGVAYVVEGSVRKQGDRVRITAQLIKAADGFHVWSDTFTRDLKDIFAVQDEIAGLIAKNLELKMGMTPARAAIDPAAYQEYLVGRAAAAKASNADLREAVAHFEKAVAIEPKFAAAWVQLASAHTQLGRWGGTPTLQAWAAARAAIDKARALEPDSPDMLVALGWILRTAEWDWRGAEKAFRRALELRPNHQETLAGAAILLYNIGKDEEAFRLGQQAALLDPLNPTAQIDLSIMFYTSNRLPEAERTARRALQLAPAGVGYHSVLGWGLVGQKRYAEATAEAALETDEVLQASLLGPIAEAQGQTEAAYVQLARLEEMSRTNGDRADLQNTIAWISAGLGERDRAFAALEKARVSRDPSSAWLRNSPYLAPLFSDPRWNVLLRQIGLADDQLK